MKHIYFGFGLIIILTIFVITNIYSTSKIEGFQSIDIDKLRFNTKTNIKTDIKTDTFALPLPLGTLPEPEPLSKLYKEIKYLSKLTTEEATNKQKQEAIGFHQGELLSHYIKFAGKHGLVYSDKHLKKISDDLDKFGLKMKSLYGRPRPFQHAFILGLPFNNVGTSNTSSYPSLHTLKARILSDQLTYNNPKYKEQLDALASKIELSQLFGGFNYPSDNKAALTIARALKPRIKYLEIIES